MIRTSWSHLPLQSLTTDFLINLHQQSIVQHVSIIQGAPLMSTAMLSPVESLIYNKADYTCPIAIANQQPVLQMLPFASMQPFEEDLSE